jgi:hypothetical protein
MNLALIAATLLAQSPPDVAPSEPSLTAGQLYEGCVRYLAHADASPDTLDGEAAICAVTAAASLASNAAARAVADVDPQPALLTFCPPETIFQSMEDGETAAAARIFVTYIDRNPASRTAGAGETLNHALVEAWPCPH